MNYNDFPNSWRKATPNSSKDTEITLLFLRWDSRTSNVFFG